MPRRRLTLFARVPKIGQAKTRLIESLGLEKTHQLYQKLLAQTVALALEAQTNILGLEVFIAATGGEVGEMVPFAKGVDKIILQEGETLGSRMYNQFLLGEKEGVEQHLIIGVDCPFLTLDHLKQAFTGLESSPLIFGPATDGGYYLVGQSSPVAEVFSNIPWSTDEVLTLSLQKAKALGLPVHLTQELNDIDEPWDLALLPAGWLDS
ncbi:MAG: TIGR04282 family arsenosugar biosynthesis glycosyltransferase [SAR324 cluster bacterium]|nr:TIGR04282 family arsenosugar biosynthesis glycosyltransferase [SAR324 cluster bacterium]